MAVPAGVVVPAVRTVRIFRMGVESCLLICSSLAMRSWMSRSGRSSRTRVPSSRSLAAGTPLPEVINRAPDGRRPTASWSPSTLLSVILLRFKGLVTRVATDIRDIRQPIWSRGADGTRDADESPFSPRSRRSGRLKSTAIDCMNFSCKLRMHERRTRVKDCAHARAFAVAAVREWRNSPGNGRVSGGSAPAGHGRAWTALSPAGSARASAAPTRRPWTGAGRR
jgi:hypothetical protein